TGMEGLEAFWLDERGTRVGAGADLHDIVRGGPYGLALVGEADCDTIWGAFVDIADIGVPGFDEQSLEIIPVSCDGTTMGGIVGLAVEDAVSYQWEDEAGRVVGTARELTDIPVGRYRLFVTTDNCTAYSNWYTVVPEEVTFPEYAVLVGQP